MQAQYIVTGSIEKSQTGFLISCWVIDQENHSIVCSFKTGAEITEFYRVQNMLAESLIKDLDIRPALPALERPTSSPEAFEFYIQAVASMPSVDRQTLQTCASLFESAFRHDHAFIEAHFQAALCYYQLFDLTQKNRISYASSSDHACSRTDKRRRSLCPLSYAQGRCASKAAYQERRTPSTMLFDWRLRLHLHMKKTH